MDTEAHRQALTGAIKNTARELMAMGLPAAAIVIPIDDGQVVAIGKPQDVRGAMRRIGAEDWIPYKGDD